MHAAYVDTVIGIAGVGNVSREDVSSSPAALCQGSAKRKSVFLMHVRSS